MRRRRKEKNGKKGIIIAAVVLVLAAVIAGAMLCWPCDKEYDEYLLLRTPIGELYLTERWEKRVTTEEIDMGSGYAVDISAKVSREKVSLYKLYIGTQTEEGVLLGYVNDVEVRLDVQSVDNNVGWKQDELDLLNTIQEDLGGIVDQIVGMDGFSVEIENTVETEESVEETVLLDTPLGEIHLPPQWADSIVTTEVPVEEGYAVEFSTKTESGTVKLSALYIGTQDMGGAVIGYVNDTVVRYAEFENIAVDGWSDEAIDTVYSVQEDLIGVVDQIMAMEGFQSENIDSSVESSGDYILFNTPVGELRFTKQWQDVMTTEEYSVDEGYAAGITVKTDSGEVKVYDLFIGTEAATGSLIGYVYGVEIWANIHDLELGDDWSDADIDVVYSIQEELEYLRNQFADMEGFASA